MLNLLNLLSYMCPKNTSFRCQEAGSSAINAVDIRHHYLFANGKFSIEYKEEYYKIVGVQNKTSFLINAPGEIGLTAVDILECNLMARPIWDMSDEEYNNALELKRIKTEGGEDDKYVNTTEYLFYLLSIGVYPFDQSHFKYKK